MKDRNIIDLTEANFDDEVLKADVPVLIEFWADWSAASRAMTPVVEAMAVDYGSPVKVARVNIETYEELTARCGVRCVPTLLIYARGDLRERIVGNATEQALRERLEQHGSSHRGAGHRRQSGDNRREFQGA